MNAYLRFVEQYRWAVLAVIFAITAMFAAQLPKLSEDSNPYLLPDAHPVRQAIFALQKEFSGTSETAIIAVVKKSGVFNRSTLDAALELTRGLRRTTLSDPEDEQQLRALAEQLAPRKDAEPMVAGILGMLSDGLDVNDAVLARRLIPLAQQLALPWAQQHFLRALPGRIDPIKDVTGLAGTENIAWRHGQLLTQRSLRDKTTSPDLIRKEVMDNPLMIPAVVSADATITLIAVEFAVRPDDSVGQIRAQTALQQQVAAQRQKHPGFADEIYIAGGPLFMAEQAKLMNRDLSVLLPLVLLVVLCVLVLYFRRPLGVMLPLLNVALSATWTLGLMAWLGVPIDLVTSVLPVFLITVCGADALHLMNEFYEQRKRGLSATQAIQQALRLLMSPVVLTTVTTVIGFLFATATQIDSIRHFGGFMAFGLMAAQFISVTFIPAWICTVRGHAAKASSGSESSPNRLGRLLSHLIRPLVAHRRLAASGFVVLLLAALWSAQGLHVEDEGASYFRPSNPVRISDDFINQHSVGTSPGWIVIDSGRPQGAIDLQALRFIDQLDQWLQAQPNVRYTYSIPKYIRRLQVVLNDNDPAWDRLPAQTERLLAHPQVPGSPSREVPGADLVNEAMLMYENSGGSELKNVLNSDYSKAVTLFTMNTTKASEYQKLLDDLKAWVEVHQPKGLHVSVAGTPVIWANVLDEILQGQLLSFFMAYGVVALVLVLWLKSMRRGLVASFPLAATMVFYFGAMSALGIDLNIGTALISYLVVGIVDYSVHFMHRVCDHHHAGHTADESVLHAVEHAGRSIFFNVVLFSLGFLTLLASDFSPLRHLGILVALSLLISGVMSIFLISLLAPWFLRRHGSPMNHPSVQQGLGATP